MNEEQEKELQRYVDLMQDATSRKDGATIARLNLQIERLRREMRDNPDKP